MIRSERQLARVLEDIEAAPGPVLFTLVDAHLRKMLTSFCDEHGLPCVSVLDPMLKAMALYTGLPTKGIPGLQHTLDENYFRRIEAVDFAMGFDDGQHLEGIEQADVILIGVSRTSKTPTCVFLSRFGIRAANIPYVPGVPIPDYVLALREPMFVGLTESPDRLIQLRATRLKTDTGRIPALAGNRYLDPEAVEAEVAESVKFFRQNNWPVIDVTRRSVEETAAEIMQLLQRRNKAADTNQASLPNV
jgi:regulator of PEP synthase PpsR (kinase-PPPase family)